MGKPVMYFEILGEEPEKLYPFYAKMFDWEINADNPMNYGYINTGTEKGIQGGIGHARFTGQKKVMFYVEVEDLQASLGGGVVGLTHVARLRNRRKIDYHPPVAEFDHALGTFSAAEEHSGQIDIYNSLPRLYRHLFDDFAIFHLE